MIESDVKDTTVMRSGVTSKNVDHLNTIQVSCVDRRLNKMRTGLDMIVYDLSS